MKKDYRNSILLIFILLLCILAIVFYYTSFEGFQDTTEGFQDTTPRVINSSIRVDNTCSDPKQTNVFDRFQYVQPSVSNSCTNYINYIQYSGFPFDVQTVCLPICDPLKGWYEYPSDRTYCVRSNCINTIDLSGQIKASWTNVCGPIAKQNYTLTSTLQSISSVSHTFNSQFRDVQSNYVNLYNTMYSYNCSLNPNNCTIRDIRFPALTSNYETLNTLRTNINSNANQLSNKIRPLKQVYNEFGCDLFI